MKSLKMNGFKFERIDISGNYFLSCGEQECKLTPLSCRISWPSSSDYTVFSGSSWLGRKSLAQYEFPASASAWNKNTERKFWLETPALHSPQDRERISSSLHTQSGSCLTKCQIYNDIPSVFLSSSFISLISSFKVTLSFRAVKDIS